LKTGGVRSSISTSSADQQKVEAQIHTLQQSQDFVVSLLSDKDQMLNAKAKLDQQIERAENAKNNTRTAGDGNNDGSSGSGFHAMDLLPLAAPLAGLLMQQKNADSGITDPTAASASTPAPQQVAGTSFGGNNGSSSATPGTTAGAGAGQQPNSPDHNVGSPVDMYPPASGESLDSGNISRGGEAGGSSSGGFPLSSSAGALGSSGSSSSGGQGGDNARKPAAAKAGDTAGGDDGMMNGGGGGGLTFNGGGSGEAPAGGDEGMKDVLQDMEATLEDSPTGIFAEAEQQAKEAEIESPDSLFPRVRACYVRNLKKGNVLNGLGEKLPEGESD
jgi:hypothetical protein